MTQTVATAPIVEQRPIKDLVRWGPIWAGLVIAVGSYLVLQLALVASGLVDLPTNGTEDGLWSAAAALVAFLLGGLTAAATAAWRGVGDGILHGLVMWAVALVVLLALAGVGAKSMYDKYVAGTSPDYQFLPPGPVDQRDYRAFNQAVGSEPVLVGRAT